MPIFASDRDLLDRFRRGEREALTTVYEQYVDTVGALARRGFTIESQGHVYVSGADVDWRCETVASKPRALVPLARVDRAQPMPASYSCAPRPAHRRRVDLATPWSSILPPRLATVFLPRLPGARTAQ